MIWLVDSCPEAVGSMPTRRDVELCQEILLPDVFVRYISKFFIMRGDMETDSSCVAT